MTTLLTAPLAREHITDLLRTADTSRAASVLPDRTHHRTPRRRAAWWRRSTVPA